MVEIPESWGEGSVYREGKGWRAVYRSVPLPNGQRVTITGYGKSATRAIERRMHNAHKALNPHNGTAKTLGGVVEDWGNTADVSERTVRVTKACLNNHLYARLPADTPMADLDRATMRDLARTLTSECTPATAYEVWKLLKVVLSHAVQSEDLVAHPMQGIRGPRYTPAKREGDERWVGRRIGLYQGFLRWLKENGDPFYYPALFLSLGLRRNELLGLEWDDVAGLAGRNPRLTARNQYHPRPASITRGLKGGAPERSFPLPSLYANALREWQTTWSTPTTPWAEKQIFARQLANGKWAGTTASALNEAWKDKLTAYINKDGVRPDFQDFYFTPHGVRHLTASYMIREGVPIPVVQDILGHSNSEMTRYYTHTTTDSKREAINAVGAGLGSMKPRKRSSKSSKANPDADTPPGPTKNAPESP